jgi:hypothetical protein
MMVFTDILSGEVIKLKYEEVAIISHGVEAIKVMDKCGSLYLAKEIFCE